MSPEAWLTAGATVLGNCIAIIGAVWGAHVGGEKAREAMEVSIRAQQDARGQEEKRERKTALRALLTELDLNRASVHAFNQGAFLHVPLERDALDDARPYLVSLPERILEAVQRARSEITAYNAYAHAFNLRAANAGGEVRRFGEGVVGRRFETLIPALEAATAELHHYLDETRPSRSSA